MWMSVCLSDRCVFSPYWIHNRDSIWYRKNKPGIDFLSPRFVSFRFGRSSAVPPPVAGCLYLSVFGMAHGTGGGAKVGGSCLVFLRPVSGRICTLFGSRGCRDVCKYVLLIIFCPIACVVDNYAVAAWFLHTKFSLFSQENNRLNHTRIFHPFSSLLKQLTFELSNCSDSSGTRISS